MALVTQDMLHCIGCVVSSLAVFIAKTAAHFHYNRLYYTAPGKTHHCNGNTCKFYADELLLEKNGGG